MSDPQSYEVFAIRYGSRPERMRSENFIAGDPHDGPMALDYFVWAIVGEARSLGLIGALELVADKASGERFARTLAAGNLCRDLCRGLPRQR